MAISLAGEHQEHRPELTRFALVLGLLLGGAMALVVFTPLGPLWFGRVTDLEPELAGLALEMAGILVLFPPLSFLTALLRGLLVVRRRTRAVNRAALVEVAGVFAALWVGIHLLDLAGAHAAGAALVTGRLLSLGWLLRSSG